MSRFIDWTAWNLDIWTWGWIGFIVFFFVWEFLALAYSGQRNTLTYHLRPMFHVAPVTWYIALGVWIWMGPHFLFPSAEAALKHTVGS